MRRDWKTQNKQSFQYRQTRTGGYCGLITQRNVLKTVVPNLPEITADPAHVGVKQSSKPTHEDNMCALSV